LWCDLQVNQLGVYRGFIDNYENAVEIVLKCMQSDQRFRTLAEVLHASLFLQNITVVISHTYSEGEKIPQG